MWLVASGAAAAEYARVDHARIVAADSEPGQWLSHGRTHDEQRYSPLATIDAGNVGALGLAWSFDLRTKRGLESGEFCRCTLRGDRPVCERPPHRA